MKSNVTTVGSVAAIFIVNLIFTGCGGSYTMATKSAYEPLDANFLDIFYDPQAHIGEEVIWGGEIQNFAYVQGGTELTIRQIPLEPRGQSWRAQYSSGKFIVKTLKPLDPSMFRLRATLIVKGRVSGSETKPVGSATYNYPLITPEEFQFWNVDDTGAFHHCWQAMGWDGPYKWKCDGN